MTGTAESGVAAEPPAATPPATRAQTRRLRWWVAAITFVGGVVVGVLAVGLLSAGTPAFGSGDVTGGEPPITNSTPGPGDIPVVAQAQVNGACLSVINEAQDVYTVLTDVGEAAADVDLQQLDDIVRRLQPIEARLGEDLPNCRVDTTIEAGPTGGVSTTPAAPEASPTR